ncbi:MAG: DUF4920 domain-containing protein [Acidobacteriota bacterium]|nr:MAG: DUF4920 domain-containing protein [Acidobacteriota bacterium]
MRLSVLLCTSFVFATVLALPAVGGEATTYGEGLTGSETVKLSELRADPDAYLGKTVRVEGLVLDVCPKRGCWIELAGDEEFQSIRVKVEDGVIVFPPEAKGRKAIAEGLFTKRELTEEQAVAWQKHQAEERGLEFDPSSVDGPLTIYMIMGTGAIIH